MTLPPFIQKYFPKRRRSSGRANPVRDWAMLLISALVLLFVSVAWNAWFFFAALEEPAAVAPVAEEENDTGIEAARASSEKRSEEEARYRGEYRFIDPSL